MTHSSTTFHSRPVNIGSQLGETLSGKHDTVAAPLILLARFSRNSALYARFSPLILHATSMQDIRPIVIDLYCGLGGWSEGFLAEGYRCIGFDIERHDYGTGGYPGELVLQDVLTLHGSQFRDAAVIVASPPCQRYSYMAMPWSRAKAMAARYRENIGDLNDLFNACFRIQREASEAAGRHIPLVVENVKGAQPWVGPAKGHYGSYYLWGDVENVGGRLCAPQARFGDSIKPSRAQKFNPDGTAHGQGSWFAVADSKNRGAREALKVPGMNFHEYEKTGQPGRSFQSAAVSHIKNDGGSWFAVAHNTESGHSRNPVNRLLAEGGDRGNNAVIDNAVKGTGGSWFTPTADGRTVQGHWRDSGCVTRTYNSKDVRRKAASAQIAKIPLPLAQWIARVYKPAQEVSA